MLNFGHCPACGKKIPHQRIMDQLVVCVCGWTSSPRSQHIEERQIKQIVRAMLMIGLLIVGSFIHAVNWDQHFFSIIPLKTKQLLGKATVTDLEQITAICQERKKHDCVEETLTQSYKLNPNRVDYLERLGHLQLQRGKTTTAAETFKNYFIRKGKSTLAAYDYAQTLSQLGKVDMATKYYRFALSSKPDVMQISVTRSYVEMLVKHNRLSEARELILHYRSKGSNTGYFMDKELRDIEVRLSQGKIAKS